MSNPPNDGNGVPSEQPPAPPEPPAQPWQPEPPAQPAAPEDASADFAPPQYTPPQYSAPDYTLPGSPGAATPEPETAPPATPPAPTGAAPEGSVPPPPQQGAPAAPGYGAGDSSFPGAPQAPYAAPNPDQGYPGSSLPPYAAAPPSQGYPGGPTAPYGGGSYGGVPMTPPQPGKGLAITSMVLGILGLVGFAVAFIPFVGFAALLVPLVAIVLGVIALVRKKPGKGFAIAGVVTGGLGLIISALVATMMTAFLLNSGDLIRQSCDEAGLSQEECDELLQGGDPSSDPATAPEAGGGEAASALEVGETSFGAFDESGEYTWFTVELTNPDDVFYEYVYGEIEAVDANGTIIDTSGFGGALIPGTTVFTGTFAEAPTAEVAELQVLGLEDVVSEPVPFDGGEFAVADLKATSDEYTTTLTGTVSSTFAEDQDALRLTILVRDESGKIVLADTHSTDRVPAGGSARFEKTFYPALPDGLTYEVYPHIP
ncbi:DUF4190 domain-containing protein [Microbacterium sp. JZ31]|uniref:DUF4190 domain-containing protein n=1 Tax=Microbacterium sp. JZ31 TaxID=1906274 RepID=UPI00193313E3|nr:DUF4190 domain-containing protein [Microbacterium sp. JZ31]